MPRSWVAGNRTMPVALSELVSDFAVSIALADSRRPQASNVRSGVQFQVGIGPHTETQTAELVGRELELLKPALYRGRVSLGVPYPEMLRQKCDLCIGPQEPYDWAVEIKLLRFLGDNGKANDNILMHLLSPYAQHRSALTDCTKLRQSALGRQKALIIYGYDSQEWPLEPAVEAFEILAGRRSVLGPRLSGEFRGLVHPVHTSGAVFGWELLAVAEQ